MMLEDTVEMEKIRLAHMDNRQKVSEEIGDQVVHRLVEMNKSGLVIGLSGGVDSTATAAIVNDAFQRYIILAPESPSVTLPSTSSGVY